MSLDADRLVPAAAASDASAELPAQGSLAPLASVHDQLYRYAEDLRELMERNDALENHCDMLRKSTDRLQESREMLDELMRHSHDIHIITDATGEILQSNPAVALLAPQQRLTGDKLQRWVVPAQRARFLEFLTRVTTDGDAPDQDIEVHLQRADAAAPPLIVAAQAVPVRHAGAPGYLHWIMRDVTHLRETEFESQVSSMVFRSTTEGVMITDVDGAILAVNPAFSRITGYSTEEVIGRNPRFLKSGLQDAAFYADFWRSLRDKGEWQGQIYNRKKNGDVYSEWLTVSSASGADGEVLTFIAVFTDLSRLLEEEKRLAHLAHHDSLTDLPNRLLLEERLEQTLTQARRFGLPFTLIFIDLDRFKEVNDCHGHQAGDFVLKEVARRLSAAVREVDTVARLGGDEFVILAPGLVGDADIGGFCAKVIDTLARPIALGALVVDIGGSLGCAEFPRHGEEASVLLGHADAAMYRAKADGGNSYVIYAPHSDCASSD